MNIYFERRQKVANLMEDNSVFYIFSGKEIMRSYDEAYPFYADRNFVYLTGLDREDMILVISKIRGKVDEKLYIPKFDKTLAKWVGGRMLKEEATAISGIEKVFDSADYANGFTTYFGQVRGLTAPMIYVDIYRYTFDQMKTEGLKFTDTLKDKYPNLKVADAYEILKPLRQIKDETEISLMKEAQKITDTAIRAMMRNVKPGMNERELEAIFDYSLAENLSTTMFGSIVASGKRATVLHYHENNQLIEDGDLVLIDLGAKKNYYGADISRTFPANGKFTSRQAEIYQLVLNAQEIVIKIAKPGVTLRQLNLAVVEYYKRELPKHGLTKDVSEYYYHGVSHEIGLDTHDSFDRSETVLKPGMVISNEPGLYIEDESIGIRIEDDLLITEEGCEDLSYMIPKEIADIEKIQSK